MNLVNLVFNRYAIAYLAMLALSGCASFESVKVYDGKIKNGKEVATIVGQYRKSWNNSVDLFVSRVDGKKTPDVWIGFPYVVQVDPGTHDLEIAGFYGNLHHPTLPKITVLVEAGKVYQIDSQLRRASERGSPLP
ncbi:hypothetical protein C8R21_1498 [Nitrosospira multiformis]|uniref:DUF2846 domain-containing protein n=1 Tax=Nitrosospira multiformis TaxID=1231 RepID=A0A2T5I1H2_9PROT|nr:hypothetical protein [Nitrosospira multiformis]PTQ77653.1 hypothetical protein C8R21_1498 [Nitrosospira multiformis]